MANHRRESSRTARKDGLFGEEQGVFMISVAAQLAGMHPQTLRMYEARGLIKPSRSPKKTRLYSQQDVERLKRIQELTSELGLNLAGVERVLEMEELLQTMQQRMKKLQEESANLERRMLQEIEAVHRSYKRELVRWEPPGAVLRRKDAEAFRIPLRRTKRGSDGRAGGAQRP